MLAREESKKGGPLRLKQQKRGEQQGDTQVKLLCIKNQQTLFLREQYVSGGIGVVIFLLNKSLNAPNQARSHQPKQKEK